MTEKKWQYKVETIKVSVFSNQAKQDVQIQERLNRLGLDGWEFVQIANASGVYPRAILRK